MADVLGSLAFVVGHAGAGWLGWRLARRALPGGHPVDVALAAVLIGVAAAMASVQLVGLATLAPVPLLAPIALAIAVDATRPAPLPRAAPTTPTDRLAIAALVAVALTWAAALVRGGATFSWDDLAYHAAAPAWWLRHGMSSLPPVSYQAYYPYNAETLSLFTMVPLHTDAQGRLATVAWMAIGTLGGLRIARTTGAPTAATALWWAAVLASPALRHALARFVPTDLAVGCAALAAVAWSVDDERPALAGVAAGLALGIKVSIAPVLAVVGVAWAVRGVRQRSIRPLAMFAAPMLLLGGGWYVRNLWLTGNPVFPAAIGPFPGPLDTATQRATSLLGYLGAHPDDLGRVLRSRLGWPLPLGLATVIGAVAAAVVAVRERDRPVRAALIGVLVAAAVAVATHPLAPFSGSPNRPGLTLLTTARYTTPAFLLLAATVPAALRHRHAWVVPAALLAWMFTRAGWLDVLAVSAALVGVGALLWSRRPRPDALVAAALIAAFAAAAAATPAMERQTTKLLFRWDRDRRVGITWQALERLPPGTRIATVGRLPGSHTLVYPLFGRRWRHEPVAVAPDGTALDPLHERTPHPKGWFGPFKKRVVPGDTLVANLRAAGVDYVVVTRWDKDADRGPPWQHAALEAALDPARRVHTNAYDEVWDVRP